MALTSFQKNICKLISANRIQNKESYIAGGTALNTLIDSSRISKDIDLFHDTQEALAVTWSMDRKLLTANNYKVQIVRERPAFIEAIIIKNDENVLMQWTCDSAYRFFPLIKHHDLGLTLHPFDLATNKVLALVGRLEVRDWIDLINCHFQIQQVGYLAWASCGKDPGLNPALILEEAKRSSHYSRSEVMNLSFDGPPPDVEELSKKWHQILKEAKEIIDLLPAEEAGKCVLNSEEKLFSGNLQELAKSMDLKLLRFHAGSIRGAFPSFLLRPER